MMVLITEREESRLEFFNNAAALNHIYRFISDYSITNGGFRYPECEKIAFFPGTFDPFTLSHKGIVQEIKKLGFEVYLSIDEFSWSKKTQPRRMRRKIITISTGNERDVYVLPDEIQINLSNKKDLALLKSLFPGKDIHVVVGSDIIANASACKKPPESGSIHHSTISCSCAAAEERRSLTGIIPLSWASDGAQAAHPSGGHQLHQDSGEYRPEQGYFNLIDAVAK